MANWDKYRQILAQSLGNTDINSSRNIEESVVNFIDIIKDAMKASMPKLRHTRKTKPAWWRQELTNSKKRLLTFRRNFDYKIQ